MSTWPVITEPQLLERLALGDDEFTAFLDALAAQIPRRTFDDAAYARALGYPWTRPGRSFRLTGSEIELLDDMTAARRDRVLHEVVAGDGAVARSPLLAIGSNAAPATLEQKFAHFPDAEDRTVLVLTGHLHDFDVGASAQPALYGAMPATLFPSPRTAVRCAILWVTGAQFTQLTWSEVSYRLGRIETRFDADEPAFGCDEVLAFVSRFGALRVDGRPVAMAAIPADGRTAPALSQEALLDAAARLAIGPEASAEALVRAIYEDMADIVPRIAATVRPAGLPFASDRWTPFTPPPA